MLAITAVLRVHFAKTIAIGNAIGDVIVKVNRHFSYAYPDHILLIVRYVTPNNLTHANIRPLGDLQFPFSLPCSQRRYVSPPPFEAEYSKG
eukprot:1322850-Amorphochlora_amoeboformis.AAC.2